MGIKTIKRYLNNTTNAITGIVNKIPSLTEMFQLSVVIPKKDNVNPEIFIRMQINRLETNIIPKERNVVEAAVLAIKDNF
ncbi:MAG: hypothetical protein PSV35_01695 [bacterium]|nr:hypothetical protein [bacterium]